MGTAVTHGIRVSARARFEPAHSDPKMARHIFSYRITISNRGNETVQLMRRHWIIRDSLAGPREVEGPGVVGETPVLAPGEEFTYSSACDLRGAFGRMDGTYLMRRTADGSEFRVEIPAIQLSSALATN
ncbi:MAG: Co2+/Mg2+ efflux protein ApaG [Flavobacteriales bacterium]|jgi:ApaG protein|nr:Co2+/Mg2+ efflux protein ApaG [Flavobacteriales bacterium]